MPARPNVPKPIQQVADRIAEALARPEGQGITDAEELFAEALALAAGHEEPSDPYELTPTASDVAGENMARLRREADWTQAALGEAMTALGHPMSRGIVAAIEGGSRRLNVAELWALAALFQVPLFELLLPASGSMSLEGTDPDAAGYTNPLTAAHARNLYFGRRGVPGEGAPVWRAAASVIPPGVLSDRPARKLWQKRNGGGIS